MAAPRAETSSLFYKKGFFKKNNYITKKIFKIMENKC